MPEADTIEQRKQESTLNDLLSVLEFYADSEIYYAIGFFPDWPCGDFMTDFEETALGYKPGKRARAILEKYGR